MNPTLASSSVKVTPDKVHETIAKHMLADGYDFVLDLEKSEGVYIYDSRHGKRLLDFFSFFATNPVGMNHPGMKTPEFTQKLLRAALHNPSNSDVYTVEMAEFVDTFARFAMPDYLPHVFFIAGGTLGLENALKAALSAFSTPRVPPATRNRCGRWFGIAWAPNVSTNSAISTV